MNEDKGKNEKNILLTKDYILNEYLLQKKVLIFLLVFLWIVTAILGILFQFPYHTLLSNWTVFLAFLFWPAFLSLLDLVYLVIQQLSIHNIVTYGIKITDDVIYKKREIQKKSMMSSNYF